MPSMPVFQKCCGIVGDFLNMLLPRVVPSESLCLFAKPFSF